jgi:sporulation protein YlmC with PRC-barrel domain
MDADSIGLGLRILDDQLLDSAEERFGRVDDIELDGEIGRETRVAALLVGAGAWRWRVPRSLRRIASAVTPNVIRRIPWELVRTVDEGAVRIAVARGELGFGTAHHVSSAWIDEVEHQTLRVSSLLGAAVCASAGRQLGRIREVQARFEQPSDGVGALRVTGVAVGRGGVAQRIIGTKTGRRGPARDAGQIEWSQLARSEDGRLTAK